MSIVNAMLATAYQQQYGFGAQTQADKDKEALNKMVAYLVSALATARTPKEKEFFNKKLQEAMSGSMPALHKGHEASEATAPTAATAPTTSPLNPTAPTTSPTATTAPTDPTATTAPTDPTATTAPTTAPTASSGEKIEVGEKVNGRTAEAKTGISKAQGGAIMDDLNKEFTGGKHHNKFWIDLAKKGDGKVKIYDASGNDKSQAGKIDDGDIMVIQSAKHGEVKVQVDGDGALGSGQDFVLSVGNKAATASAGTGLTAVNNPTAPTDPTATTAPTDPTAVTAPTDTTEVTNIEVAAQKTTATNTDQDVASQIASLEKEAQASGMFSDEELRNLIAALMHQLFYASGNQRMAAY